MGLAAGRQLSEKGANVVIIARDQNRLHQGVEFIQVRCLATLHDCSFTVANIMTTARGSEPSNSAIPPDKLRLDLALRIRPRHGRNSIMELGEPTRHSVVLCGQFASDSIHRHARITIPCADGQ